VISVLAMLRGVVRSRDALHVKVLALRHQLQGLQRSRPRQLCVCRQPIGGFWGGCHARGAAGERHSSSWSPRRSSPGIAKASACSGRGRVVDASGDHLSPHVRDLIQTMSQENPRCGARHAFTASS
jgi:hypothetical protein